MCVGARKLANDNFHSIGSAETAAQKGLAPHSGGLALACERARDNSSAA